MIGPRRSAARIVGAGSGDSAGHAGAADPRAIGRPTGATPTTAMVTRRRAKGATAVALALRTRTRGSLPSGSAAGGAPLAGHFRQVMRCLATNSHISKE